MLYRLCHATSIAAELGLTARMLDTHTPSLHSPAPPDSARRGACHGQPLWQPLITLPETRMSRRHRKCVCTTGLTGTVLVSVGEQKIKSKHVCGSVVVEKARHALGISACGLANSCLPGSSTRFMEQHVMCPPPPVLTSPFSSQTKEGQGRLGHTFLQVEKVQLYLLR